jgi:hypothetical protein
VTGAGTDVPILLIAFNRPEPTSVVFEAIRRARPAQLFVAVDGPRDRPGESAACERVRAIVTDVDWPCDVRTLFREDNLGCRYGVQAAIDWFFEQVDRGVILEDDCVPDPTFLAFAGELLERYRDDERVMMISGDYFAGDGFDDSASYYFTRYTHIWGWGSWRRAWQHFDPAIADWPERRASHWLDTVHRDADFRRYWTDVFDRVHADQIDTWDYSWQYSVWAQGGLVAIPTRNLITNIGFGEDATHTVDGSAWQSRLPTTAMEFPLVHPDSVVDDEARDAWTDRFLFGTKRASLARRVAGRLRALR